MDFTILVGRGGNAVVIGVVSICFPFLAVLSLSFLLQKYTVNCIAGGPFMVGMAALIAFSPFLVVYQFLSEFQLLSSELGRLSLTNVSGHFVFQDLLYQIGSLVFVALLMLFVIRPMLLWVIRRTPQGKQVKQGYVVAILLGALLMAVGSDAIGLSILEGSIFFGIVVPDGPPLGSTITEKTDTLYTVLRRRRQQQEGQ